MYYCIGCGGNLGPKAAACDRCGTAARGSRFSEALPIRWRQNFVFPKVCCCCLKVKDKDRLVRALFDGAEGQESLDLQIPFCRRCHRQRLLFDFATGMSALLSILGVIAAIWGVQAELILTGILAMAGIGLFFSLYWLLRRWPFFLQPGHVAHCQAVSVRPSKSIDGAAELVFANRAFFEQFRRVNTEPQRPSGRTRPAY